MSNLQIQSLLEGLYGTLVLSGLTFAVGGLVGIVLALALISPSAVLRSLVRTYVTFVQGIPLLVLMGLAFFGPTLVGIDTVTPLSGAIMALSIWSSAYLSEVWMTALVAVPKQQWEAAECLGFSRSQRMLRIVAPQALQLATPPTVGFMVQIVKNTSVASLVVGYAELTYNAQMLNSSYFQPFLFFGAAAALYFVICYPLSALSRRLERKLNVSNR